MTAPRADDREAGIAALRCTCPSPAGVSRNHLNACPLFDVRSAYRQGWEDAHKVRDAIPAEPRCADCGRPIAATGWYHTDLPPTDALDHFALPAAILPGEPE